MNFNPGLAEFFRRRHAGHAGAEHQHTGLFLFLFHG